VWSFGNTSGRAKLNRVMDRFDKTSRYTHVQVRERFETRHLEARWITFLPSLASIIAGNLGLDLSLVGDECVLC
jgi:hypothetical protein